MPPLGRQHQEVERMGALDLEPARAAIAGLVGRLQGLCHDAFVTGLERRLIEGPRLYLGGGHQSGHAKRSWNRLRQRPVTLSGRAFRDARGADAQTIEEE